jgi:ribonuclease P protein component
MRAAPRAASAWLSDVAAQDRAVPPLVTTAPPGAAPTLRSIGQSVDFERVLRTRSRSQTPHFSVHHLPDRPSMTARARRAAAQTELARKLSTGGAPELVEVVDDSAGNGPIPVDGLWAGAVVPKRHARRSVTRSLLKRQIRSALARHAAALAPGLWVVRLRAPFDKAVYPSAASEPLKRAARAELETLFGAAR